MRASTTADPSVRPSSRSQMKAPTRFRLKIESMSAPRPTRGTRTYSPAIRLPTICSDRATAFPRDFFFMRPASCGPRGTQPNPGPGAAPQGPEAREPPAEDAARHTVRLDDRPQNVRGTEGGVPERAVVGLGAPQRSRRGEGRPPDEAMEANPPGVPAAPHLPPPRTPPPPP